MGEMLSNRTIRDPSKFKAAFTRWAISGSYRGSETGFTIGQAWAKDRRLACLVDDLKSDPYKEKTIGTTCCSDKNTDGVRESPCTSGTFNEAKESCEDRGMRLCSALELMAGKGESKGCGFDMVLIWSADVCHSNESMLLPDPLAEFPEQQRDGIASAGGEGPWR